MKAKKWDDICDLCGFPMKEHDDGECPSFFEDCNEDRDFTEEYKAYLSEKSQV